MGPGVSALKIWRPPTPNNGKMATASTITGNTVEGSLAPIADIDFYSIGSPAAGSRLFVMADTNGSSGQDSELRLTTDTDTLEYDDDDGDTSYGAAGSNIQGAMLTGVPAYLRLNDTDRLSHFAPAPR